MPIYKTGSNCGKRRPISAPAELEVEFILKLYVNNFSCSIFSTFIIISLKWYSLICAFLHCMLKSIDMSYDNEEVVHFSVDEDDDGFIDYTLLEQAEVVT